MAIQRKNIVRALVRTGAALVAFACHTVAGGQSLGTTFSDLWWNPAESGWGVTVDQQQDVMFLTFFVYRADGSPYWVTALLRTTGSTSLPFTFAGDVYENSGPYFGGPFNPAQVSSRKVGTATFVATGIDAATLTYTVNGVAASKSVQRETLATVDFTGVFNGVLDYKISNCPDTILNQNGQEVVVEGQITILHHGSDFRLLIQSPQLGGTCTFAGTYSQTGSIGNVSGAATCSDGSTNGTFQMVGLQWTLLGFTGAVSAQEPNGCSLVGAIGGMGAH